jgi:hypothetical protein
MKASDGRQGAVRLKIRKLGPYTSKVQGATWGVYTSATDPGSTP